MGPDRAPVAVLAAAPVRVNYQHYAPVSVFAQAPGQLTPGQIVVCDMGSAALGVPHNGLAAFAVAFLGPRFLASLAAYTGDLARMNLTVGKRRRARGHALKIGPHHTLGPIGNAKLGAFRAGRATILNWLA